MDDNDFFMLGELYGYGISQKRFYDFGDKKVDYYANGFDNLINFQFKSDANKEYENIFFSYDSILQNDLKGKSIMGKSCIRFKKMDDIPYDLIAELATKMSPQDWIDLYEANVKKK